VEPLHPGGSIRNELRKRAKEEGKRDGEGREKLQTFKTKREESQSFFVLIEIVACSGVGRSARTFEKRK